MLETPEHPPWIFPWVAEEEDCWEIDCEDELGGRDIAEVDCSETDRNEELLGVAPEGGGT